MRDAIALLILAIFVVAITVIVCVEHRPQGYAMRVTKAAAQPCPKLANPCDRVNCNRINTKGIA